MKTMKKWFVLLIMVILAMVGVPKMTRAQGEMIPHTVFTSANRIRIRPSVSECASAIPPSWAYIAKQKENLRTNSVAAEKSSTLYRLPLTIHIVRNSKGEGGFPTTKLSWALTDLNYNCIPLRFSFFQEGPIDYIDSDDFYDKVEGQSGVDSLRRTHSVDNTVNVYFTPKLIFDGKRIGGIASFPTQFPQGIIVSNSDAGSAGEPSTLTHEMGHYFGLFHTHETSFGRELVNGSNCSTTGDKICDTPADPELNSSNISSCNYTGDARDQNGDLYRPEPKNFMSYAPHECRVEFTPEQIEMMREIVLEFRLNLLTPANDNFENAASIAGNIGSITGNTSRATQEFGEPYHAGYSSAKKSVWYSWVAPADGRVVFDTIGSDFDTVLAAYFGPTLITLNGAKANNDAPGRTDGASKIEFDVTGGTRYFIAVAGFNVSSGQLVLNWAFTSVGSCSNQLTFLDDVTIDDGMVMQAGQTFTKTWLVKNTGTCPWNSSFHLDYKNGQMVGDPLSLPSPGIDVNGTWMPSINFKAPTTPGRYKTFYVMKDANGVAFDTPIFVEIVVQAPDTTPPDGHLDAPAGDVAVSGLYHINGWAGDPGSGSRGAAQVQVLLDGNPLNGLVYGLYRPDLKDNSGFGLDWDTNAVSNGPHVLQLRIVDKAGNVNDINNTVHFKRVVNVQNAPIIADFSPKNGAPGSQVVITGANFTGVTGVSFGGVNAAFIINSPTQITATVPEGALIGSIAISSLGGTTNSAATFIVAPRITSFTPDHGGVGQTVTLNGANFEGVTSVTFNGTATSFTFVSSTQVTTSVPADATIGRIAITTPGGTGSSATDFIVAPRIANFSPNHGDVGQTVTVNGANFFNVTGVTLNGQTASFEALTLTQLTFRVPQNALTGRIAITTPAGTATSATDFIVAPRINSFSPTKGAQNAKVVISGANFSNASSVKFNGTSSIFTVNSSTQITTSVPARATIGRITVTTLGGTATSASDFLVAPVISFVSLDKGVTGSRIVLHGLNFDNTSKVTLGDHAVAFTLVGKTTIVFFVPGRASGFVSVTTPAGTAKSATQFVNTTNFEAPALGLSPTHVRLGDKIRITGALILPFDAIEVRINGVAATDVKRIGLRIIEVTVPAGAIKGPLPQSVPITVRVTLKNRYVYLIGGQDMTIMP